MKIILLHDPEMVGPPADPVLDQLETAVRAAGHEPSRLAMRPDVPAVASELRGAAPDLVFNLVESFNGKSALDSNVAGLLNLLNLRYTGSSPTGLAIAGDKALTKKVLAFHGIQTPQFATLYRGDVDHAGDLAFPLIVKPPQEDASLGITTRSVVYDVQELLETIGSVHAQFRQPVLVEQFVQGREFYVGVLGNQDAEALPLIELDFSGFPDDRPRVASWAAKWGDDGDRRGDEYDGTRAVFPDDVTDELRARIQTIALDAFHALRLRDYGRVDVRLDEAGEIFVLEVNPNCYLERDAEFARGADRHGLPYEELIGRIIELAAARYAR